MRKFFFLLSISTLSSFASASDYSKIFKYFNSANDSITYADLEKLNCTTLARMNPNLPLRTYLSISEGITLQERRLAQHIPATPSQVTYPNGPLLAPVILPPMPARDIPATNEMMIGKVLLEIESKFMGQVDRAYISEEKDHEILLKSLESGHYFLNVTTHEFNYLTTIKRLDNLIFFTKSNQYVRSSDPDYVGYCWPQDLNSKN